MVGSLRKGSYNKMVASAIIRLSPVELEMEIIEIGHLPFYNPDQEDHPPSTWTEFRTQIKSADGVLFITPEYNRSFPAVIKNAIDVGSRPAGASVWNGKPGAILSASPGMFGGFGANQQLRQPMVSINVLMMQQPEAYLSKINEAFDENGNLVSERTVLFLKKFIDAYAEWIEKILN